MSSDNQRVRRHVNKSANFKQNNVRLDLRSKGRPRKAGREVNVESPEFQLLVRLYVPSNLLITNNKVDRNELMMYLPIIVNDSLRELNYEIHIFLSCIVSKYVLSWYPQKLNTDDTGFISRVYSILCEVVKDFSSRVLTVVEGPLILHAMNDIGSLVARHVENFRIENHQFQFSNQIMEYENDILYDEKDYESVKRKFLAKNHLVFQESQESTTERLSLYCRILAIRIIEIIFEGNKEAELDLSPIARSLVSSILGDLVLKKVIHLLSRPEFLLKNVIFKTANKLNCTVSMKKTKTNNESVARSINMIVSTIMQKIIRFFSFWQSHIPLEGIPTIEEYFFIPLADSIFCIKLRRPVISYFCGFTLSLIFAIWGLKCKLESVWAKFMLLQIWQSSVLEDSSLAGVVKNLRESLFERAQEQTSVKKITSLELLLETKNEIMLLYRERESLNLGLAFLLYWLEDEGTTEKEVEDTVENFLLMFNEGVSSEVNFSEINILLALNLIDCILKYLYTELVQ